MSIDIWCKGGILFEKRNKAGVAHFLEHMIFKGSNELKPGEFDFKIESLGGSSNASTGYDDVHYCVVIPPKNFYEALSLLTNLVFQPNLTLKEFNLEREVIVEEIKQQNDQPEEILFNYFLQRFWKNNIYGKSILGNEKQLEKLNIYDLEEFHRKNYSSENSCIAIAGNLPKDICKVLNEYKIKFEDSTYSPNKKIYHLKKSLRFGREDMVFKRLNLSRILIAWEISSSRDYKTILGFEMLASLLVDGRDSVLKKPLKEEENLVESINIDISSGEIGSILILEACCSDKNIKNVEKKINFVLNDLINNHTFTISELCRAKRVVKSGYLFNLETTSQQTAFYGNHLLWGRENPLNDIEKYLDYWENKENFKKIINFLSKDKFTLIARAEE